MKKYYAFALSIITFTTIIVSCSKSDDEQYIEVSPVRVDLTQVPYAKLSDYHFFDGPMKDQKPALDVLIYEPASALFTDYAHKKRFVYQIETDCFNCINYYDVSCPSFKEAIVDFVQEGFTINDPIDVCASFVHYKNSKSEFDYIAEREYYYD
jgi:hypothetical protein